MDILDAMLHITWAYRVNNTGRALRKAAWKVLCSEPTEDARALAQALMDSKNPMLDMYRLLGD